MSAHAAAQLRAYESNRAITGVVVEYHRASDSAVVVITAVPGSTIMEVMDDAGAMVKVRVRDYLVKASDLATLNPATPERGDQIHEQIGSITYIHEVIGPGGAQHFNWSSQDGSVLRIHTKEFDTVAAPVGDAFSSGFDEGFA